MSIAVFTFDSIYFDTAEEVGWGSQLQGRSTSLGAAWKKLPVKFFNMKAGQKLEWAQCCKTAANLE